VAREKINNKKVIIRNKEVVVSSVKLDIDWTKCQTPNFFYSGTTLPDLGKLSNCSILKMIFSITRLAKIIESFDI